MALDLATLMNLGVIPKVAMGGIQMPTPDSNLNPNPSTHPIAKNGKDPLAPLTPLEQMDKLQPWRSDALLAFGAGLLSGHSFGDGLARGATAAQAARDSYVNPKRNLIADGAFTYEQFPDGSTKLIPNPAIQKYEQGLTTNSILGKLMIAQQAAQYTADRQAAHDAAEDKRVQAQIDASDRRSAAALEQSDEHFNQAERDKVASGAYETPYQRAADEASAKEAVALPGQIAQNQEFSKDLQWLMDPENYKALGLGIGTAQQAKRALTTVLPGTGSITGIDPAKKRRAEQILNHIKMIATRQWLKGTGSRITNYDLKLATGAQPNLDMDPGTFLRAVGEIKRINDIGVKNDQAKLERLMKETNTRSTPSTDSGGGNVTSKGIRWHIVSH